MYVDRWFSEYLFLRICPKQGTLRPSSFHVNIAVNWRAVIINQTKNFLSAFWLSAAMCTNWYRMKSQAWNPFTLCAQNFTFHSNICTECPYFSPLYCLILVSSTNHQFTLNPIIDPSWCKHTLYPPPIQFLKLLNQS